MIGAFFLALYWLLWLLQTGNRSGFVRGAVAALVAALLSAFFWMPALGDVGLVQVQNLQQDFFNFRQYFLSWGELFALFQPFDQRAANPPFPHAPGWAGWATLVAGCSVALFRLKDVATQWSAARFWGLAGTLLALSFLLLTLPVSAPLWERIPGLSLLQFPSRFLPLAGLGMALAGGAAIGGIGPAWQGRATLLVTALILAGTALFLFPRHPFLRFETIRPAQTTEAERVNNLWGMTSGNEFLPRWASLSQATGLTAKSSGPVALEWQTPQQAAIRGEAGTDGSLVLPIHYFPAWQVTTQPPHPTPTRPTDDGLLAVDGVAGVWELSLVWAGTDWQRRGEMTALTGLLLWLLLIAVRRPPSAVRRPPTAIEDERFWLLLSALILCCWLGRQAIVGSGVGWFQPTSPPDRASGAQHPLSVTLGMGGQEQILLLGWEPRFRGEVRPGDSLGVRLYWQPVAEIAEPLHSFLHLYSAERKHSWAIGQNQNPGRIPTTSWLSALYYVDELTLTVPLDQPPGNFALAVGLVTEEGERLAASQGSDGLVEIGRVEVSPLRIGRGQPQPEVKAPARVGEGVRLNGYDLLASPGGPLLRTYWEVAEAPSADLRFFVHLLTPGGERLAQWDGPPLEGIVPTSVWQSGHLYIDRRVLWLPENLASGNYTIQVGLYDPASGARLAFTPSPQTTEQFTADALVIPFVVPK